MNLKSILGYSKISPFKNEKSILIDGDTITMKNTDIDLYGIPIYENGQKGEPVFMKANEEFPIIFKGAKQVLEIPAKKFHFKKGGSVRDMPCNKPKRTPDHKTKSHVVKACEGGKEKVIRFGQQGVSGSPKKKGESAAYANRRKRFKARHAKNISKGKMSAAYWANKVKWQKGGLFNTAYFNPKNWGVPNYSDNKEFKNAFEKAKRAGEKEFIWNNKKYTTNFKGTPEQERRMYYAHLKGEPVTVQKHSVFSQQYLPGHISASVGEPYGGGVAVNYGPDGNYQEGVDLSEKGSEAINIFGVDIPKFKQHAMSLPSGEHEGDGKKSDWNLITKNCADEVCKSLDIQPNQLITTPEQTLKQIKNKYPFMDITGRTVIDYLKDAVYLWNDFYHARLSGKKETSEFADKFLNNIDYYLQLYYAPDLPNTVKEKYADLIQHSLVSKGYELPKSKVNSNKYDGVIGPETLSKIEQYRKDSKKNNFIFKQKGGKLNQGNKPMEFVLSKTGKDHTLDGYKLINGKLVKDNTKSVKGYLRRVEKVKDMKQIGENLFTKLRKGGLFGNI